MLPGGAEGEEDDRDLAAVRDLAAGRGADPGQRPDRDLVLDPLEDEGQGAGEDEVELFLALVDVDAQALARLQLEPVDAEALGAEVAADRFEELASGPAGSVATAKVAKSGSAIVVGPVPQRPAGCCSSGCWSVRISLPSCGQRTW